MSFVFRAGPKNIEDLQNKVKEGITKLKGLEIGDELAVEIMAQLVEGKKTPAEIVERVYGLQNPDEGFISSYGRVWREIRRLEAKGLVSRKLFGKDKPYRLTQLAIINLARIGGEEQQRSVIPRIDLVPYLGTVGTAVTAALQGQGLLQLPQQGTQVLLVLLCLFVGVSFCRLLESIRRVY